MEDEQDPFSNGKDVKGLNINAINEETKHNGNN